MVPLEIEVVVSRFQADKRISSIPYLLAVNAAGQLDRAPETQLNMGADVPVPSMTFTPVKEGANTAPPMRSYNYRSIGTSITAAAATAGESRFELRLNIDESSIFTTADNKQSGVMADMPAFRSFKSRNTLLLRDGQTRQYTAATDRVSGEVVKVDVTLRVVK